MPVFRTIHTSAGLRLMAQAQATGKPINLVAMAVGDGKGKPVTPNPEQTQLAREIAGSRAVPNRVYQREGEDNIFYAELVLPDEVQGVTLREWGIFDDTGALFAVGNLPESYIPKPDEGAYGDAIVRVKFAVVTPRWSRS